MIQIKKSATADTRTCDFANTSKETLLASSGSAYRRCAASHFNFMIVQLCRASDVHDHDKNPAISTASTVTS